MNSTPRFTLTTVALVALLFAALAPAPVAARGGIDDGNGLVLRVSDAVGQPGGVVAVVVRTYAPKPIKQGQVCFRPRRGPARLAAGGDVAADQPFATLLGGYVFGPRGQVSFKSSFGETPVVQFSSPAALVNAVDGPIAVLYLKLADSLVPGDVFTLDLDLADTFLFDRNGAPITVVPKPGELRIKAVGESIELRAVGGKVDPGKKAALGVATVKAHPWTHGQIALRWAASVQAGVPSVRIPARFGRAVFTVDRSTPGLLLVQFTSPGGTLNSVPGKFLEVTLPTKGSTRHGAKVNLRIDPNLTYLANGPDDLTPFTMKNGVLTFN